MACVCGISRNSWIGNTIIFQQMSVIVCWGDKIVTWHHDGSASGTYSTVVIKAHSETTFGTPKVQKEWEENTKTGSSRSTSDSTTSAVWIQFNLDPNNVLTYCETRILVLLVVDYICAYVYLHICVHTQLAQIVIELNNQIQQKDKEIQSNTARSVSAVKDRIGII